MNRLAQETSPYLRQHRDNPVDWFPWGDEAFARARDEDKPILLSVGYSACHWCHVMAHESFEDDATAAVMNELFVNVKVDREERPDVDAVYMDAVQAITGQGGWPMTVFLTPDGQPFFGGTYFPKRPTHGRPGFVDLLDSVASAWRDRRADVVGQAEKLAAAIGAGADAEADAGAHGHSLDTDVLRSAYDQLASIHDPVNGGFGRAPKFPQVSFVELAFRAHAHNRSDDTRQVLTTTLDAMAAGGIYDHLGGGFARYSVDATWLVPHFEKMLYDQAQLVRAYVHGWQVTGNVDYRQVVEETVSYVLRDLRQREGGLCSAEDADSEGEEGKFYVWRPDEIARVLGDDAISRAVCAWWGVTPAGNFEGANILHRPERGNLARSPEIELARQRLLAARDERIRPGLDDKVLTEWNAMFVAALAEAGAVLERSDWIAAAAATAEFLVAELRQIDGRWLRSWQGGRARHLAYAVDYAWLVEAFVRLSEATGEARWIAEARAAADAMLALFWDPRRGGLFTTGDDAERLIVRQKDIHDGATPSANSVAAVALTRLGALTGDSRYADTAAGIVEFLGEVIAHQPIAVAYALAAVDLALGGITEVVVGGERRDLVRAVHQRYLPSAVLAWGERYDSPLWEGRDDGAAYVCRNYACQLPATDVETLVSQLWS